MPDPRGSIVLGEVAQHLTTLHIVCNRCDRKGRAAVDRLLAQHGPQMPIPSLLALLAIDCPRRQANKLGDPCGANFPELPDIFLKRP